MPIKLAVLTLFFSLYFSCVFSQQIKIDSSLARTLRIDPQSARGAAVSQIFDEVEFIPLETTKESLFGNISQLEIVDGHFVFMDYDTRALYIFTKEGKYRAKITANQMPAPENGKKKEEFWSFLVAQEGAQKLIQIQTSRYSLYFDLDGKQVKKVSIKNGGTYWSPMRFSNGTTSVTSYYSKIIGKDTTAYQMGFVKNNTDTTGYFPFKSGEIWSSGRRIYKSAAPDEYIYSNYYGYDLFKIKPESISLAFRLIFPAVNTLPKDFLNNPIYKNKVSEFLEKNKDVYYGISNTYLLNNHLYLKLHTRGWDKSKKRAIIYNLKTTELTSLEDIEPDSLSYHLPITDSGAFYDFQNKGFLAFEDGYFYTSFSSLAMFTFKEQSESKQAKYPSTLENYFKTGNKKNNPVIVKLKPKKN